LRTLEQKYPPTWQMSIVCLYIECKYIDGYTHLFYRY
jgi:hypothetical protein